MILSPIFNYTSKIDLSAINGEKAEEILQKMIKEFPLPTRTAGVSAASEETPTPIPTSILNSNPLDSQKEPQLGK